MEVCKAYRHLRGLERELVAIQMNPAKISGTKAYCNRLIYWWTQKSFVWWSQAALQKQRSKRSESGVPEGDVSYTEYSSMPQENWPTASDKEHDLFQDNDLSNLTTAKIWEDLQRTNRENAYITLEPRVSRIKQFKLESPTERFKGPGKYGGGVPNAAAKFNGWIS